MHQYAVGGEVDHSALKEALTDRDQPRSGTAIPVSGMRSPCSLIPFLCVPLPAAAQDATELVRKADEHARGRTIQAEMTMQVIRPTYQRAMTMTVWGRGTRESLVLITAPAKEKGIVYLKRGKEVWNWIPSVERTIKMPPSMMSQSWMGTDFTNDDLVKEASIVEDYTHTLRGDSVIDGRPCHVVRMVPKPEAAVVWGHVLVWIDKQEHLMLHAQYFDEDGGLVNTMHASEVRLLGGRMLPALLEMLPADKPQHRTVIRYSSIVFDAPIADGFFTTQNMNRVR
jgi:outer membrane lipoprotein-sorting protein